MLPAACHARAGGCTGIRAGSIRGAGAACRGGRSRAGRAGAGVGVVGSVVRAIAVRSGIGSVRVVAVVITGIAAVRAVDGAVAGGRDIAVAARIRVVHIRRGAAPGKDGREQERGEQEKRQFFHSVFLQFCCGALLRTWFTRLV